MLPEELFTHPPPEAPVDPKNTFIAPSLLRACCACGHVRDEAGPTLGLERWISQEDYREAHGVSPSELALAHAYCPTCFANLRKVMRQFFQSLKPEP